LANRPDLILAVAAIVVVLVGALTTGGFTTSANFKAILASVGILWIVAVGMTCITISGNLFSLSLGVTVTVASMTFLAWLGLGVVPAILLTIAFAGLMCALQGLLIGGLGANPIVVTIAASSLQLGGAEKFTSGATVYPHGKGFEWLAHTVAGFPVSIFVLVALVILLDLWLRLSRLGREIYLVGENRNAARAAALRVTRTTVVAFAIAGACAGIGGILLGAANKNAVLISGGDLYTFNAIAVVLVGGVAVTGGRGSVARTVLGALFVAAISDMLLLRGYSTGIQTLVTGLFVLLAIVGVQLRRLQAS
jgi:ribose/xylose/arabinose/galactoside ABC-type transport system permease subunit